jgi:hypothetical protein
MTFSFASAILVLLFSRLFLLVSSSLFSLVSFFIKFYFYLIYFLLTMAQPKKHVRTLHDRLKIIGELEKNLGEKCVDIAKQLRLSASTLNCTIQYNAYSILWLLILVCNNPVFFQYITKIKIHPSLFFLFF